MTNKSSHITLSIQSAAGSGMVCQHETFADNTFSSLLVFCMYHYHNFIWRALIKLPFDT